MIEEYEVEATTIVI